MTWTRRITATAALVGGASGAATAVQILVMPTFLAWESEVVAAFLRGLPV